LVHVHMSTSTPSAFTSVNIHIANGIVVLTDPVDRIADMCDSALWGAGGSSCHYETIYGSRPRPDGGRPIIHFLRIITSCPAVTWDILYIKVASVADLWTDASNDYPLGFN